MGNRSETSHRYRNKSIYINAYTSDIYSIKADISIPLILRYFYKLLFKSGPSLYNFFIRFHILELSNFFIFFFRGSSTGDAVAGVCGGGVDDVKERFTS